MSRHSCHEPREQPAVFADRRLSARAGVALVLANARYWTTVAPEVRAQLARWRTRALEIEDPQLRTLALHTLQEEGFAAEVAATLATLTPRRHRTSRDPRDRRAGGDVRLPGRPHRAARTGSARQRPPAVQGLHRRARSQRAARRGLLPPPSIADPTADTCRSSRRPSPRRSRAFPQAGALAPTMLGAAARCAEAEVLTHAAALSDSP